MFSIVGGVVLLSRSSPESVFQMLEGDCPRPSGVDKQEKLRKKKLHIMQ